MSFLRRRFGGGGDDSPTVLSREPSPGPDGKRPSNLRLITAEHLQTLKNKTKHGKRRNFWVFGLGGIFGLILAGLFASSNDLIDMSSLEGMNLETILDALPAGFVRSAQQLQVRTIVSGSGEYHNVWVTRMGELSADFLDSVENRTRRCKL